MLNLILLSSQSNTPCSVSGQAHAKFDTSLITIKHAMFSVRPPSPYNNPWIFLESFSLTTRALPVDDLYSVNGGIMKNLYILRAVGNSLIVSGHNSAVI